MLSSLPVSYDYSNAAGEWHEAVGSTRCKQDLKKEMDGKDDGSFDRLVAQEAVAGSVSFVRVDYRM